MCCKKVQQVFISHEIVLISTEPDGDVRIVYTELHKKPYSVQNNVSAQRRARQEFGSDRLTFLLKKNVF